MPSLVEMAWWFWRRRRKVKVYDRGHILIRKAHLTFSSRGLKTVGSLMCSFICSFIVYSMFINIFFILLSVNFSLILFYPYKTKQYNELFMFAQLILGQILRKEITVILMIEVQRLHFFINLTFVFVHIFVLHRNKISCTI